MSDHMTTEEILAMQGAGFPVDNDELEVSDEPVDLTGVDVSHIISS